MEMKAKIVALIILISITMILLSENLAYAQMSGLKTQHTIYVRVIIPPRLSMNLDKEWISQNLNKPEVEAFSELKEDGIIVEKVRRNDSIVWLFTKTE